MKYLYIAVIIFLIAMNISQAIYYIFKKPKIVKLTRIDTLRVYDTVYLSSSFSFFAKRCDSLRISQSNIFSKKTLLTSHKTQPKWGIGIGLRYGLDKRAYYYIIGEYVLKNYFTIGGYISPATKEVGIHGTVRF